MDDLKKQARKAGWLCLLQGLPAPFALLYVPKALIVQGDPSATADRIRASETLLRLSIAGELWNAVLIIPAVLALYHLFKGVSERLSTAMTILFLVSVPVMLVSVLNHVAALIVASGPAYLSSFDQHQLDSVTYFFMRLHGQGLIIAQIFWGLWLFPYGMVAMRSGFIPRALGASLMIAGAGYVVASMTALTLPALSPTVTPIGMTLGVCELPILAWLLIWGARVKPTKTAILTSH